MVLVLRTKVLFQKMEGPFQIEAVHEIENYSKNSKSVRASVTRGARGRRGPFQNVECVPPSGPRPTEKRVSREWENIETEGTAQRNRLAPAKREEREIRTAAHWE